MTFIAMQRPHLLDLPAVPPLADGYVLRRAHGPEDDEALAVLLTAAFGTTWTPENARTRLTAAPSVRTTYVITWEGQFVATASHRYREEDFPNAAVMHWVGTHPDHRGRGLASALLIHLMHDFAACGDQVAALETQDFRLPAIRAYLRYGFVPMYEFKGEDQRSVWATIFPVLLGPH